MVDVVSAVVPAPPHEVFPYLTEPELLPTWVDGLRESRPLGDATLRVGARSVEVVAVHGKDMEIVSEVIALDPDRMLGVRITYDGAGHSDMVYELTAVPEGTEVRLTAEAHYRGVARVFGRLMRTRKRLQANLDRLAEVVQDARSPDA